MRPGIEDGTVGIAEPLDDDAPERLLPMEPEPRTLRVHTLVAGRKALLRVHGAVDVAATPALAEALEPYRRAGQWLILDLRSVDYIESPGLRLLMSLGEELQSSSGEVRLVVRHPSRVERTLGLVGLDQRLSVFFTPREAWQDPSGAASGPAAVAPRDLA